MIKTFFDRNFLSEIFSSKLFWLGLILKIIFAAFLASKFLTDLFLPFANFYVVSGFSDPYEHFFVAEKFDAFPYPSLMLWIISLPYWMMFFFIKASSVSAPFLSIFALRVSVLICDFAILLILVRWLKSSLNRLLVFYWLSPVLIYINYIHGQLDCIPIAVLLLSLFFVFRKNFFIASLFLGAALACKTNILIAVPFFIIYLFSQKLRFDKLLICFAIIFATFYAINFPHIHSQAFLQMVLFNNKQSQIFDMFYPYNAKNFFYFIPAIYFVLLVKAFMIKTYNRDIFIMFLGFGFGVLNLFIPPMQGWYYWVLPFFAYFYAKQKNAPYFLFFTLQISYLTYFLAIKDSDYLQVFQIALPQLAALPNFYDFLVNHGLNAEKFSNLSFTILQISLLLNCLWIYRSGIASYLKHKLISKPYLIGISGDSGVGKTTMVSAFTDIFSAKNTTAICGDDMHKWERGHKKWHEFTHLNPTANRLHDEMKFLRSLKNGQKIYRRSYDHNNGKFTEPKIIAAKKIIIFEGLHSFYVEAVRKIFDIKIFVKPEKELRLHWKIIRDKETRGYDKDQVLEQLKRREQDSEKFISSQEKYADIKIEISSILPIKNLGDADEKIILEIKISFNNSINVDPLLEQISANIGSVKIAHGFDENDEQFIQISGDASSDQIKLCGDVLCSESFEEIDLPQPRWEANTTGLIQLFLAFYIINSELNDEDRNC